MKTGRLVLTRGINDLTAENTEFAKFVTNCLKRYLSHDWGDIAKEDRKQNDDAAKYGNDRILAAYENAKHPDWKIWIITEWDGSATTILFPSEY